MGDSYRCQGGRRHEKIYVSQPYTLEYKDIKRMVEMCERRGLTFGITGCSDYYLGRTFAIIWRTSSNILINSHFYYFQVLYFEAMLPLPILKNTSYFPNRSKLKDWAPKLKGCNGGEIRSWNWVAKAAANHRLLPYFKLAWAPSTGICNTLSG